MASGIYGSAGISACDQTARDPEVTGWMRSLSYSRERLASLVGELNGRLTPVLANAQPEASDQAKAQQAGCALAAELQSEVIRLNDVEACLSSILRRLEI